MNGFPFTLQCNRELANSAPDLLRVQGSEYQLQLLWPDSALAVAVYGSYIYIALGCGSGRKETVVQLAEGSGVGRCEDALRLAAQFVALLPSFNPDPPKRTSVHNEVAYGQH